MSQEAQQKTFNFVESPKGGIKFRDPLEEFATMDNLRTSLSETSGTHTQYLWWLALAYD